MRRQMKVLTEKFEVVNFILMALYNFGGVTFVDLQIVL